MFYNRNWKGTKLHYLDMCGTLITPKTDKFMFTKVKKSSNNNMSINFFFEHPENISSSSKIYTDVMWTYTKGAVLPPCDFAAFEYDDKDNIEYTGKISNKSVNLGGVQFFSLIKALLPDTWEEVLPTIISAEVDEVVEKLNTLTGTLVGTPMSGTVVGKDGVERIQFLMPKWTYSSDAEENTECLEQFSNCFRPGVYDEEAAIHREGMKSRVTRPKLAVTPVGAEDGDEFLA